MVKHISPGKPVTVRSHGYATTNKVPVPLNSIGRYVRHTPGSPHPHSVQIDGMEIHLRDDEIDMASKVYPDLSLEAIVHLAGEQEWERLQQRHAARERRENAVLAELDADLARRGEERSVDSLTLLARAIVEAVDGVRD